MKVYLETFGCRANQYDSEQVRAMLVREGHEITDVPLGASAAVFNSCFASSASRSTPDLSRTPRTPWS